MRRAEEGLNARLDAEEYMPNHVADSADHEDQDAEERELVAGWQRLLPGIPPSIITQNCGDKKARHGEKPRVEHRVPGRKEAFQLWDMIMCPTIEKDPTQKPSAEHNHHPVKSPVADEQVSFCPVVWFDLDASQPLHHHCSPWPCRVPNR